MNWQHLQTFLWLRWRLMANQSRRGGAINAVLTMIVAVCALAMIIPLFLAAFVGGLFVLPKASPAHLLYAGDALVVAFVFFWGIGLMAELQRTESLSLSKFLHLPVSVGGAFLINYASSLVRLSVIVFLPVMCGLALALVFTKGGAMLLVVPLLAAFLLMITALSYQFQGWLASLMNNPRRRRTVVVSTTALFVLICQLPQLLNVYQPWRQPSGHAQAMAKELDELTRAMAAQEISPDEYQRRQQEVTTRYQAARDQNLREATQYWTQLAKRLNQLLPIGWLPLGVMAIAAGDLLPAVLGLTGMTLLGAGSLWRAYRTTLRIYQGGFTANPRRAPRPLTLAIEPTTNVRNLLELRLPGLSEPVSAVALAGFRSLVRAPEAKMMLLTPVLMGGIFGSILFRQSRDVPELARPMLAIGAMTLVLFGMLQLMGNQFGFDRDGFRVFVLSAARRRDILLGKNLAFAPLAFAMAAAMLAIVQLISPLRWTHFLAALPQFASMFLLFCLLANLLSLIAPLPVAAGSLKAGNPKLATVFLQFAMFSCLFPLTMAPVLLPIGTEALFEWLGWTSRAPVNLLLSLVQCALVVLLYRAGLNWQAKLLQAREQTILETITGRAA